MIDCADIAAIIHQDMVEDPRNGYSWEPRWGGDHPDGYKSFTLYGREYGYWLGSYDCSSSVITAWAQALRYTKYEGVLDDAYYTGNMRAVFEASGLFYSSDTPNKRGDIYLNDGNHTAMCLDGGDDGVLGYDAMSQFSINENGGVYGGEVGDQTDYESYVTEYHDYPWDTNLHYNGGADNTDGAPEPEPVIIPVQDPGDAYNDLGLTYRVHAQNAGWMDPVHDGQTAGSTGYGSRIECLKITPPEGVALDITIHAQNLGDAKYRGVERGVYDPEMGTTGQNRAIEGIQIDVTKRGGKFAGCVLYYQVHMKDIGWSPWFKEGTYAGTRGESRQIEAIRMRFQSEQDVTSSKGTGGILYQVHAQDYGWLPVVHDGMTAGTTGQSRRIEALRILDIPTDAVIDIKAHIENIGDIVKKNIKHGDVVTIGTTGEGLRLEAITITEVKPYLGKKLCYRGHVSDSGWTKVCHSGELCGTTDQSRRLEAIEIWYE